MQLGCAYFFREYLLAVCSGSLLGDDQADRSVGAAHDMKVVPMAYGTTALCSFYRMFVQVVLMGFIEVRNVTC